MRMDKTIKDLVASHEKLDIKFTSFEKSSIQRFGQTYGRKSLRLESKPTEIDQQLELRKAVTMHLLKG
jgi:hypothetical protein